MKYYEQYRQIHRQKKYGVSGNRLHEKIAPHIPVGMKSLLDYGAGQSMLAYNLGKRLGIEDVGVYDPCVEGRDKKPERSYDFVTCTDVMEHVPEEEIDGVLADIWGYQEKGALFMIALNPAHAKLPNGENAHCTVKPIKWWEGRLRQVFNEVTLVPEITNSHAVAFLVRASS